MTKYYRVKKDTFLWEEGAIISNTNTSGGYSPVEDIWNKTKDQNEYITSKIIEDDINSDFFERVYADNLEKMIFKTKDQLKDAFKNFVE